MPLDDISFEYEKYDAISYVFEALTQALGEQIIKITISVIRIAKATMKLGWLHIMMIMRAG